MAGFYNNGTHVTNLRGTAPKDLLVNHGPTKLLVDNYHWHQPDAGIVASYTPTAFDVHDHFGIFRGVDQIEAFAQATTGSCTMFLECEKTNTSPVELSKSFIPRFISIGAVNFIGYLEEGDTFISIGFIRFYKFRQMVCEGRIYKAPAGMALDAYFEHFTKQRLLEYDLSQEFTLVAEFKDITGRSLKNKQEINNN